MFNAFYVFLTDLQFSIALDLIDLLLSVTHLSQEIIHQEQTVRVRSGSGSPHSPCSKSNLF